MKILELNKYYYTNSYLYYLFDSLIYSEKSKAKTSKKEFLFSIGISYSSYRREKSSGIASNMTMKTLTTYFKINNIEAIDKNKYETIINRLYYNSYYKNLNLISKYLVEIQEFIDRNNYLRPLFVLFKVFGYLNMNCSIDYLKTKLSNEINYLKQISSSYFYDQYEVLYLSIVEFLGLKINSIKLDKLLNKYDDLNWMVYTLKASNFYIEKRFSCALSFLQKALTIYNNDNNIVRSNIIIANIAAIYNIKHDYISTLKFLDGILKYVYSDENAVWISNILQHYIHALFMLNKYHEIIQILLSSILDLSKANSLSLVELILTIRHKGNELLFEKYKLLFYNDPNVQVILEFIETKEKSVLLKLENTIYFNQIIKKIKKKYFII